MNTTTHAFKKKMGVSAVIPQVDVVSTHTVAFVGDAIFAGSVGGPNISYQDEINSVRDNILSLSDNVMLFPGHGPVTTVGEEKLHNPFF